MCLFYQFIVFLLYENVALYSGYHHDMQQSDPFLSFSYRINVIFCKHIIFILDFINFGDTMRYFSAIAKQDIFFDKIIS